MPEPKTGESRDDFVERCIPIVIDDGTAEDPDQAVAVCNSMWEDRNKAAKFRRITYNGVAVQATSRRSSDREDKAWARTVRRGDTERVVHYADPDLPMRRNNPEARKNFMARHNCSDKKDPFAPGFWACYDWSNPSEKETFMSEQEEKGMIAGPGIPDGTGPGCNPTYTGAVSFAEMMALEKADQAAGEVHDLTSKFEAMVGNIMMRDDVEDKATAISALAAEYTALTQAAMDETKELEVKATWTTKFVNDLPDSSFLYVESSGKKDGEGKTVPRSLRHFPYKDGAGKVDLPHLRNAIARIPQSNAPGLTAAKKRSLQEKARGILRREQKEKGILERIKELVFGESEPEQTEDTSSLTLWKEADGRMHWMALHSNNYRDDDRPPEILSSAAHKEFVAAVDAGEWPLPELRFWHIKGTKFGETQLVAYHDDTGFMLSKGVIDEGKEHIAEYCQENGYLVSHGMPTREIRRDPEDPTIIVRYRTKEISWLPALAAANKHTAFLTLKEGENMEGIPTHKQEAVEAAGFDLDELAAKLEATKKQAEEEGRESKEVEVETKDEPTEPTEAATEAPEAPMVQTLTAEDVAKLVQDGLAPVFADIGKRFAALEGQMKELSERGDASEQFVKEAVATTPAASLAASIRSAFIGNDEARVDGRAARHDAPKETKAAGKAGPILNSKNPLANDIINTILDPGNTWVDDLPRPS